MRVGQGWDIHRLVEGRPLRLAGVEIPFERGLLGHSDGDVVLHAVADALLGAVAAGDLGMHFSDRDPQYAGADSALLLGRVCDLVEQGGQRVSNVDVTVLAERPRLAPHARAMRGRLAELLGLPVDAVSVKAKTTEGLGAVGRGEAIAAMAVVLVERVQQPRSDKTKPARAPRTPDR
jgi:2-C-methyl-D-erythritol 2,4-cyclodiphosphate synthase